MWNRELARWDAERRTWDAREAQLLQQIADLQNQLVRLAHLQPQPGFVNQPPGDTRHAQAQLYAPAPPPALEDRRYITCDSTEARQAQQDLQRPAATAWDSTKPAQAQQEQQFSTANARNRADQVQLQQQQRSAEGLEPLPDPEQVAAFVDRGSSQAAEPGQRALQDLMGHDLGTEVQAPFAAEFAAAMEAVNSTDVLSDWREVLHGQQVPFVKQVSCHRLYCMGDHPSVSRTTHRLF